MIDHLVGRPSPSWKRAQVFLVIFFWLWRIWRGNSKAPRLLWLTRANRALQRFSPWQIIVSTLTGVYAIRNFDKILGLSSPEPLARLYSPSYYRATWISTGLDAGFATAMSIRPKWLRDLCSMLFSVYYIIYANEADEKLRRFRAVPTVEMLRTTWEKTTNPYLRMLTNLPRVTVNRKVFLPRPRSSSYRRPIAAYLYFSLPEKELAQATELILDFPGGGFVAMTPEHHEERLRIWAIKTGRPILSLDYGKAPEYPYPFANDEAFDAYRILVESVGTLIGMSGRKLAVIMSGDSAGVTMAFNVVLKILEHNSHTHLNHSSIIPQPLAIVCNYAALDFNFSSWMSPDHLRVLRSEQSSGNLPGIKQFSKQKDHLQHVSPLSMVGDKRSGSSGGRRLKRRTSWKDTLRGLTSGNEQEHDGKLPPIKTRHSTSTLRTRSSFRSPIAMSRDRAQTLSLGVIDDKGSLADGESDDEEDFDQFREEDRPIQARVRYLYPHSSANHAPSPSINDAEYQQRKLPAAVAEVDDKTTVVKKQKEPIGTRLTMTSRTGYFQDRIVSPSMMRAMAILYIGPHRNPDFATDYYISPILTPSHLLAKFPPLLMQCGEKDPFVDDTIIFTGRVREAKRARKVELDLTLSGKSARFGESLRMSTADRPGPSDDTSLAAMREERDKLAKESEDDWVQMVLFSDWSHGYLQMPSLMNEAKAVVEELAEWMDYAFKRQSERNGSGERSSLPSYHASEPMTGGVRTNSPSPFTSETETDDAMITFVAKRHQERSRDTDIKPPMPGNGTISGSNTTMVDGGGDGRDLSEKRPQLVNHDSDSDVNKEYSSRAEGQGTTKPIFSRQTGQTITETELMRRRRLLDSHIFE